MSHRVSLSPEDPLIRQPSVMQNYSDSEWFEYIVAFRRTDPGSPEIDDFLTHFDGLPAEMVSASSLIDPKCETDGFKPPCLVLGWLIDEKIFWQKILEDKSFCESSDYAVLEARLRGEDVDIRDPEEVASDLDDLFCLYVEYTCKQRLGYLWIPSLVLAYGHPKVRGSKRYRYMLRLHDTHESLPLEPRIIRDRTKIKDIFGFDTDPRWYVEGGSLHWSRVRAEEAHLWV